MKDIFVIRQSPDYFTSICTLSNMILYESNDEKNKSVADG